MSNAEEQLTRDSLTKKSKQGYTSQVLLDL